jgi:hypothetical protein
MQFPPSIRYSRIVDNDARFNGSSHRLNELVKEASRFRISSFVPSSLWTNKETRLMCRPTSDCAWFLRKVGEEEGMHILAIEGECTEDECLSAQKPPKCRFCMYSLGCLAARVFCILSRDIGAERCRSIAGFLTLKTYEVPSIDELEA